MGMSFKERKDTFRDLREVIASFEEGLVLGEFINNVKLKYGVTNKFIHEFLAIHEPFIEEVDGVVRWKK